MRRPRVPSVPHPLLALGCILTFYFACFGGRDNCSLVQQEQLALPPPQPPLPNPHPTPTPPHPAACSVGSRRLDPLWQVRRATEWHPLPRLMVCAKSGQAALPTREWTVLLHRHLRGLPRCRRGPPRLPEGCDVQVVWGHALLQRRLPPRLDRADGARVVRAGPPRKRGSLFWLALRNRGCPRQGPVRLSGAQGLQSLHLPLVRVVGRMKGCGCWSGLPGTPVAGLLPRTERMLPAALDRHPCCAPERLPLPPLLSSDDTNTCQPGETLVALDAAPWVARAALCGEQSAGHGVSPRF